MTIHDNAREAIHLHARLTRFDGSREQLHERHALPGMGESRRVATFAEAEWDISGGMTAVPDRPDAVDGHFTFRVTKGAASDMAVALEWAIAPWSRDVFVMLPAAAYNGNRYQCRPYSYPPMVHEPADIGPDAPLLVTDVPRLSHADGAPSRLQVLTGDVTTPAMCFYAPHGNYAFILLTEQGSVFGNHGLTIEESPDRARATLRIEAPGVRRETLYTMSTTATPSWDRGAAWPAGASVVIRFRLFVFRAQTVQDLYERFAVVRRDLSGPASTRHDLPFSAAWRLLEAKHNRENWDDAGYYRLGTREIAEMNWNMDWQTGWVGGGMLPVPLLIAGENESRRRAVHNIDWIFSQAQHPSGLFHAVQHRGMPRGDGYGAPGAGTWHMVRKQADALYFLVKAFHVLRARETGWKVPTVWEAGIRKLADAFVRTFRRQGQLGQYLDCETGVVVVGGSTAAAMAPGGLALAGQYFGNEEYVAVAEALAERLDECDVRRGITVGGPGEILKCPDSESAFAMLESFVVLYEVTGDLRWLARAEAMAVQCLTWCASYDYAFPPTSWLGRLDVRAAGSVWANVQNKHSAPGICTLSGDSLFRLFRYTGNRLYLDQIQETAHNATQYISRADRQLGDPAKMKSGDVCERVNFSDWEGRDNIGDSLFGSCVWPEVALMLMTTELPGIYVQPDTGLLCVFDHLDVRLEAADAKTVVLACHNPTAFDAEVRVFAETASSAAEILGRAAPLSWPIFMIPAGEMRRINVCTQPLDVTTIASRIL